ncbi:MAG: ATP-dependent sacrificial sulfur transferase LarE [Syntrophorhabdaceae bacterium]|nr:ATP-dependent sacrificial sulfur transferase LarE [Syntrophorhabdaceae bacterium]
MELIEKYERLKAIIKDLKNVVVAFSGGVDSTLLLKACIDAVGKKNVLAIIGSSSLFPKREIEEAKTLAERIGAEYTVEDIPVMSDAKFIKNDRQRCYHCKSLLLEKLWNMAEERGFNSIVEGSNLDDLNESRPGRRACIEKKAQSPLLTAELKKDEIRRLSKMLSLPNYNKPASPCLATRIPYGIPIDIQILKKIELSEDFIRRLGITHIRVRYHGSIVRIEAGMDDMAKIIENREEIAHALSNIGFIYITLDLEGYRTGSMDIA